MREKYAGSIATGAYIFRITKKVFSDSDLQTCVEITLKNLSNHMKVLELIRKGKMKNLKASRAHRNRLDKSAHMVIEAATSLLANL